MQRDRRVADMRAMKTTTRAWSRRKRREHRAARQAAARAVMLAADEPTFIAMEVSDAFLARAKTPPSDRERERVEWVAMCVGSYLAEVGRPGQWGSIHVPELSPWLSSLDRRALRDFCFTLAWLVSFLGTCCDLSPGCALRIISELAQWSEDRGLNVDVRAAAGPLPAVN
jgi:hypothetical protein